MKFKETGSGSFEQPPVGTHIARCVKLIDIGTQKSEYQGVASSRRQCIIGWELPNELMTTGDYAGQPFTVTKFYTQSLNEKANLRHDLVNWRGREFTAEELNGFEAKNILGVPCMLSLTKNDKDRTVVTGVMACPKGTSVPAQVNKSLFLSLEQESFDRSVYDGLSDGMKKMIDVSPEFKALSGDVPPTENANFDNMDDDIPF